MYILKLKTDWDFTVEIQGVATMSDATTRVANFDDLQVIRDSIEGKAGDVIDALDTIIGNKLNAFSMVGGNREVEWYEIPPPRFCSYRMDDELSDLPEEFRSAVYSMAYEAGHSCGVSEVESIASDIVGDLIPAIKKYTKRITTR